MGASCSHTAPPLVEVSAPGGKVLVPPGTSFSFQSPQDHRHSFLRARPSVRPSPVYRRVPRNHSPSSEYSRNRNRDQPRGRPRHTRATGPSTSTDESRSGIDMSPPRHTRGMRGAGGPGYGGGGMGPIGLNYGGRRGASGLGRFDDGERRARSALDLHSPYPRIGMNTPRAGMGGMQAGPGLGMGMSMDAGAPEDPSMFRHSPAMGAAGGLGGGNPYAYAQDRTGTPFQAQHRRTSQVEPQPQRPMRPPGLTEIPMGVYNSAPTRPTRANTEPQTAPRLNRTQPVNKKVGPSGQEWIEGDPFLDACTCTTNCNCRKGQRVLYRAQAQDGNGNNGFGEIRYVLKDDLGKDCGDHSRCNNGEDDKKWGKGKKKGKSSTEDECAAANEGIRELNEKLKGFHAGMEAISEQLGEMNMNRGSSAFGGAPTRFEGIDPMNPRITRLMRPHGGHYGMGGDPMAGGQFQTPRMPRESYEDDSYIQGGFGAGQMGRMNMGGGPDYGVDRRVMPAEFMPRRAMGRGGPRGSYDMGKEMRPYGGATPMGGRGRRSRGVGRRRRPGFADEYMDAGMGMGMRGGLGGRREEEMEDDEGWEDMSGGGYGREDDNDEDRLPMHQRGSPSGRRRGGGRPMSSHMSARGGGRQAHVDEDDEDSSTRQ